MQGHFTEHTMSGTILHDKRDPLIETTFVAYLRVENRSLLFKSYIIEKVNLSSNTALFLTGHKSNRYCVVLNSLMDLFLISTDVPDILK